MFKLPELPYAYEALEPYIDKQTMELHHKKHHQTYVDKLNQAIEGKDDLENMTIEELLSNIDNFPDHTASAIRNHGGGHYNHSLFWEMMTPVGTSNFGGKIADAINASFGDLASFQDKFTGAAVSRFGSGWAWLVSVDGNLEITSTANQDCPLSEGAKIILGLDVWEHAYYLKYQNRRPEYIDAWWKVVNWDFASSRLG